MALIAGEDHDLHIAAAEGKVDQVTEIIKAGVVDINRRTKFGWTPLHLASSRGHKIIVDALVEAGADLNVCDRELFTPLHECCRAGYADIAQILITKGAEVNCKSKSGGTPLHFACVNEHTDVIKTLILNGAATEIKTNQDVSPLQFMTVEEADKIMEFVEKKRKLDDEETKNQKDLFKLCNLSKEQSVQFLKESRLSAFSKMFEEQGFSGSDLTKLNQEQLSRYGVGTRLQQKKLIRVIKEAATVGVHLTKKKDTSKEDAK